MSFLKGIMKNTRKSSKERKRNLIKRKKYQNSDQNYLKAQ